MPTASYKPVFIRMRTSAFTLVELLVVIGIIALLISILLPSLQAARRVAQRTACAAKLHQIMIAAQLHRQEHHDYYPLAGVLPGWDPVALEDVYSQKYDYYNGPITTGGRFLCPITYSLETEMQGGKTLNGPAGILTETSSAQDEQNFLDPSGLNKIFLCPAHATSPLDVQPKFVYLWMAGAGNYVCQPQSFIFNEFVLGWNDNLGYLKGKGSLIHQPAMTMFAADGLGGSTLANHPGSGPLNPPMYTVYSTTAVAPVSLADALNAGIFGANAGDKANFDLKRHAGKINIAFCDGHVEAKSITTGDLTKAYIMAQ